MFFCFLFEKKIVTLQMNIGFVNRWSMEQSLNREVNPF